MKLQTTIKPRANGTVVARNTKGQAFTFTPNEHGELECDVTDEALVAQLLVTEDFYPVDDADFGRAVSLAAVSVSAVAGDEDDGDGDGDDDDDVVDMDALPIEGGAAKPEHLDEDGKPSAAAPAVGVPQVSRRRRQG